MHDSGTARTAVSLSEVILNNSEFGRIYFSASVSILLITNLEDDSLFCDKYKYRSLKYELCKYPAYISLTLTRNECLSIPFFGLLLISYLYLR